MEDNISDTFSNNNTLDGSLSDSEIIFADKTQEIKSRKRLLSKETQVMK